MTPSRTFDAVDYDVQSLLRSAARTVPKLLFIEVRRFAMAESGASIRHGSLPWNRRRAPRSERGRGPRMWRRRRDPIDLKPGTPLYAFRTRNRSGLPDFVRR